MKRWRGAGGAVALAAAVAVHAASPPAAALLARHAALQAQLADNPYGRPLYLESTQTSGDLQGDVYAVFDAPYATVSQALQRAEPWCDVLLLHLNVKACSVSGGPAQRRVNVSIGKKAEASAADAYRVSFAFHANTAQADHLQVRLDADEGPLGTKNYRIAFEAVPLDGQRSFIHMSYAYGYGLAARLAMQGYLATLGRGKVGFSITGRDANGRPVYVDNVRGVVERNTMRYCMAIEAYLGALSLPPAQQLERRLRDWYAATERYRLQLHEIELGDYLAMKRVQSRG